MQAARAVPSCGGTPRLAAIIFGEGRHTVAAGLAERRTGIIWLGAQAAFSGRTPWEDTQPEAAEPRGLWRKLMRHTPPRFAPPWPLRD